MTVLADRLTAALAGLPATRRIDPADLDAVLRQIRLGLLEADVALPVVRAFLAAVTARATGPEMRRPRHAAAQLEAIVADELTAALGGATRELPLRPGGLTVVALVGPQGAGKTSFAAKLAARLVADGHRPLLAAADLARPGAVAQLTTVAAQAGAAVFAPAPGNGIGDPVTVAAAARAAAAAGGHDVLIVDTAGRRGTDTVLMAQATDVIATVAADEVLLVLDSLGGQDVAVTVAAFTAALGVTGAVLTKCDGDARGGAALTIRQLTGLPILFTATGEKVTELEVFHPDRHASRILGRGDTATLLETAERAFDDEQAQRLADVAGTGQLTFDDFLSQMRALRRMGSLTKFAALLPGAGELAGALAAVSDADLGRVEAIVCAMTPAERARPELIGEARAARIAAGSGTRPEQVAALVEQLFASRERLAELTGGRGMPRPRRTRPKGSGGTRRSGRRGR